MTINYFDFHAHLDEPKVSADYPTLFVDMYDQGVGALTVGVDHDSSVRAVNLANTYDYVWACVGQHPTDYPQQLFDHTAYQQLVDNNTNKITAVGECGLDYYWLTKSLESGDLTQVEFDADVHRQAKLFTQQIHFASTNNLPLMLHVRPAVGTDTAHQDALRILEPHKSGLCGVVFHFYTENAMLAKQIVDAGYYISLPGVVTFADLDETIVAIPLERMFVETDSPVAAPKPYRGKTNCPLYVPTIYQKIAEAKGLDVEVVRTTVLQNVRDFLKIDL